MSEQQAQVSWRIVALIVFITIAVCGTILIHNHGKRSVEREKIRAESRPGAKLDW